MKASQLSFLCLFLLVVCLVTVSIIGASVDTFDPSSLSLANVADRRHDTLSADCIQVVSTFDSGMNGQWIRQPGLYNGHAFYYNTENDRYLLMTRPNVHRPTEMYYAVHQGPLLDKKSTSVMLGYCAEPYLHILDCNGRWRSNFQYHEATRFEVCQQRA